MKAKYIFSSMLVAATSMFTSCSDFFDQESDHVVFTDKMKLDAASDTIYSLTGIMGKMQALGDRTILLGEVRGDLVDVTSAANADIRELAQFNVDDQNKYNSPKDYYAVINSCNLYLAKADTALKNNRNVKIFEKEFAAVKAFRAWTYLQLAINYGRVPFVTEPITTEKQAKAEYETKDIKDLCNWLVNDIAPYANVLETPGLGNIGITDSKLFYFPIYIVMGDLNLWAGNYKQAALDYYHYISTANGANGFLPIGGQSVNWGNTSWTATISSLAMSPQETYNSNHDLITMIPGDSIPSDGNYSQLRNIFNTTYDNDYKCSLVPSVGLQDISAEQVYCLYTNKDTLYAPRNLTGTNRGDLRLKASVYSRTNYSLGDRQIDYQEVEKHQSRNVHIYRKVMVYLRMAEALNRAGYPHFAYEILASGVNNDVIEKKVLPYCDNASDSAYVAQFNFPYTSTTGYIVPDITLGTGGNTIGIHSRGSGWTWCNKYYPMPDDSTLTADARKDYQIEKVEDLIVDEGALEFAFEGTRYYDLMRVALRRNDPAYLANRIYKRRGADRTDEMKGIIKKDLMNPSNWFLSWGGKIGM